MLTKTLRILLLLPLLLFAAVADLQAQGAVVDIGKPFILGWDYTPNANAAPALGFAVELNGSRLSPDIPLTTQQYQASALTACGQTAQFRVGTVWSGGVEWSDSDPNAPGSQPFNVLVAAATCPPNAPTNLRLILVITQMDDGSFRMRIEAVEVK